ncbi:MAG: hypothetical protein JW804_07060 [Sedimentisphaerales bacterium]|nr:hypothetical protein [Sedimentisphaerales bacterium]
MCKQYFSQIVFILITSFLSTVCNADVTLPAIISSNMVLQQDTDVPLWGWAEPNENIQVQTSWGSRNFGTSTKAGSGGDWEVKIKTPKAGGPYTITIKGNNSLELTNILIGEVWICSGQSNMEMPVGFVNNNYNGVINYEEELTKADYPQMRFFDVKNEISLEPEKDCVGSWQICDSKTAYNFSAVGFFFGKKLHNELNVPIGLISSDWGGTPAEAWTSAECLEDVPGFEEYLELLKDPVKAKKAIAEYEQKLADRDKLIKEKDDGFVNLWHKPDIDDSGWDTMNLPTNWEEAGLENFDGVVWFRKTIELSKDWTGKELTIELGAIDDEDITYFNGIEIGTMHDWSAIRKYKIPAELAKEGKNVISVRVYDGQSAGGMTGPAKNMKIYKADNQSQSIALDGIWKYSVGLDYKDIPQMPEQQQISYYKAPANLYNAMLHPIIPFGIRGAIWYQGESNAGNPEQYKILFPAMIQCWRGNWMQGDFPFYYVQIAPYENYRTNSAFLREAQFETLSLSNTGMVVTTDITNLRNIHPRNKQDAGKRLALLALAKNYGSEIVCSGPLYKSMEIQGDKIRLYFDYIGGGLTAQDGDLTDFTIAGADKKFVPAKAVIDGNTVVVSSDNIKEPVAVRFGFDNAATPNFFNKAGLPASTFRTDDW